MRTTSYKSIRDGVISRMGIDPAQTLMDSQATALAEYLTTAAATSWTFFDWPEIYLTEERTPNGSAWFATGYVYLSDYVGTVAYFGRAPANSETTDLLWRVKKITTNNNGDVLSVETAVNVAWDSRASATYAVSTNNDAEIPYILFDQDNLSPIGEIMAIWDADPTSGVYARKVRYLLNEDRVLLIDATSETGNVWVQFLLPQPRFTTDEYSAGAAYSAGDVVYYNTTGDCYVARKATTGNLPSDSEYWRRYRIPSFLADYLKWYALAETLSEDGQMDKANFQFARAEGILQQRMDDAWLRKGEVRTWTARFN
jgi:hypothetical protein